MRDIAPLSARHQRMLEMHAAVAGVPHDVTRAEAAAIAQQLHAHNDQVLAALGEVMKGAEVIRVGRRSYQAMITGVHCLIHGTSGIGKTTIVKLIAHMIGLPLLRLDGGQGDLSDMKMLGEEKLKGGEFHFVRGVLTQPGVIVFLFDEVARAPANVTSLCLQAMAERSVRVVLYGRGDLEVPLSPFWMVICTANPFGYGGSATKNEAFFDRLGMGLDMPHPPHAARVAILKGRNILDEIKLPEIPLPVPLADIRAALRHVEVSDAMYDQIVNVSYLVSPRSFREAVGWDGCAWEPLNRFQRAEMEQIEALSGRILTEGSNPRGEELILLNAVSNALIDGRLDISVDDVREAARAALRFRLKPFPGCDAEVPGLLDRVLSLVLPG
jgi:MoxR-like ATPase